jgi:hypothetical protein
MSSKQTADTRVSITIHVTPTEAGRLETAAARAGQTRSGWVRLRALGQPEDESPIMACLAQLLRLHHRLDDDHQLDAILRGELIALIRALTEAARAEVSK